MIVSTKVASSVALSLLFGVPSNGESFEVACENAGETFSDLTVLFVFELTELGSEGSVTKELFTSEAVFNS